MACFLGTGWDWVIDAGNPEIVLGSPGSERQVPEHDFIIPTSEVD